MQEKTVNKKIATPGIACNKHGKIDDILKLNWLPVEDRICMNTVKLAYKEQFPLKISVQIHLCVFLR